MTNRNDFHGQAAAILNAAWWVRYLHRPDARSIERRRAAIAQLAAIAAAQLQAADDPEPVLYAIAAGLYDRSDPRFRA